MRKLARTGVGLKFASNLKHIASLVRPARLMLLTTALRPELGSKLTGGHQLLDDLDVPLGINMTVPNAARMYDYYLGGDNNFPADREAAEHVLRVAPWIRATALENRAFLGRAVEYLAGEAGIRQFVDIGTGLPIRGNVHEVAHRIAPDARVAYADNDPIVLGQSRSLLSKVENTATIRADLRHPQVIAGHPDRAGFIDWTQPVALLLVAIMHFIQDYDDPRSIVSQYREAMAPGSYIVISHIHQERDSEAGRHVAAVYAKASAPLVFRSRAQIADLFAGFELLDPGLVALPEWRPQPRPYPPGEVWGLAGVGRLPS
jgi:hypothetical protein